MNPDERPRWLYILETHGFGALVALLLMYAIWSYAPAILKAENLLEEHVRRDSTREAILVAVCLNTAKNTDAENLCWAALANGTLRPGGGH